MNHSKDYELEFYEKYYGDAEEVKRTIENCPLCSSKMILSHSPDSLNLIMQETSECPACDYSSKRVLHKVC